MTCPDTELLLEVVLEDKIDPETEGHVRACAECSATARLVREMQASYRPNLRMPDEHIEARIDWLVQRLPAESAARAEAKLVDALISGALALATVVFTVVLTGSLRGGSLWGPGLLGVIAMIAAAGYERNLRHHLARA